MDLLQSVGMKRMKKPHTPDPTRPSPPNSTRGGRLQTLSAGLLALLLSACGGGDSSGSGPTLFPAGELAIPTQQSDRLVTVDYGGFRLLYDCSQRTALRYEYVLTTDTGTLARPSNFTFDTLLPTSCLQQTSTGTYASVVPGWDRGHLVTSNHMDYNADYLKRANFMSNVVPQVSTFNQGIWLDAENVAECYRDIAPLRVVGGVVYDDTSNDDFLQSHGIATPDWFWKAIVTTDPASGTTRAIAWRIPNRNNLAPLDSYLVSISELERWLGSAMVGLGSGTDTATGANLTNAVKAGRESTTWPLPANCSFSAAPASPD